MIEKGSFVCVFCASQVSGNKIYAAAAEELGTKLALNGYNLVYGGGGRGLMGIVSKGAHTAGAKVLGIIPNALIQREGNDTEVETIVVNDMHTRKRMMNEKCSAFITLPGGFGTFEELLEMTTWSLLSIHSKPIIVLNINNFYEPLMKQFDNAIEAEFIKQENKDIVIFCSTVDEAIEKLSTYQVPGSRFELDWTIKDSFV
ncbi:hypothetical protein BB559_002339 [Furculomyces boomerangus]|uniref:Cytokinin riboside 5'-monophosphate phosphoribohydrolase n=2 Tax=Harpellales TaxID=61421 RepID=A0A2T9YW62_9FUNG|nr:hypothetical protein BB559_002339 [Furculomyces boomerangus]PVZ99407.1 hypothetical protein BB558_004571 [Smittium angustum]